MSMFFGFGFSVNLSGGSGKQSRPSRRPRESRAPRDSRLWPRPSSSPMPCPCRSCASKREYTRGNGGVGRVAQKHGYGQKVHLHGAHKGNASHEVCSRRHNQESYEEQKMACGNHDGGRPYHYEEYESEESDCEESEEDSDYEESGDESDGEEEYARGRHGGVHRYAGYEHGGGSHYESYESTTHNEGYFGGYGGVGGCAQRKNRCLL